MVLNLKSSSNLTVTGCVRNGITINGFYKLLNKFISPPWDSYYSIKVDEITVNPLIYNRFKFDFQYISDITIVP